MSHEWPTHRIGLQDPPPRWQGARLPDVDPAKRDLEDPPGRVTADTVRNAYWGDHADLDVYFAYVPMDQVPASQFAEVAAAREDREDCKRDVKAEHARCIKEADGDEDNETACDEERERGLAECVEMHLEEGAYDWSEIQRGGTFPAPKLHVDRKGTIRIVDGNHRLHAWSEQNYTHAPVWVLQDVGSQNEKLGAIEAAAIVAGVVAVDVAIPGPISGLVLPALLGTPGKRRRTGAACAKPEGATDAASANPEDALPEDLPKPGTLRWTVLMRQVRSGLAEHKLHLGESIGRGKWGETFLVSGKRVVKITSDASEAASAWRVLRAVAKRSTSWEKLDALVRFQCVYGLLDDDHEPTGLYAIVMERLHGRVKTSASRDFLLEVNVRDFIGETEDQWRARAEAADADPDEFVRLAHTIVELHRLGIPWTDLHDDNVLLGPRGHWRIIDIGFIHGDEPRQVKVPALDVPQVEKLPSMMDHVKIRVVSGPQVRTGQRVFRVEAFLPGGPVSADVLVGFVDVDRARLLDLGRECEDAIRAMREQYQGRLKRDADLMIVVGSEVVPRWRRRGVATLMYTQAIREAARRGALLIAHACEVTGDTTEAAVAVWESPALRAQPGIVVIGLVAFASQGGTGPTNEKLSTIETMLIAADMAIPDPVPGTPGFITAAVLANAAARGEEHGRQHAWLPVGECEPAIPMMKHAGEGHRFLLAYRRAAGDPEPMEQWQHARQAHIAQLLAHGGKLWDEDGDPTPRALALVQWAYHPEHAKWRSWLHKHGVDC